jgi:8-oxo-dGTP pyrophosphatase MutT (NUDIX family)
MPIPPHVAELRARIGHALLWLATVRAVTIDDHGHVLLGRYPGSDEWTIPGGVIDPGEQPGDAAVRECYEETGEFQDVRWHHADALPALPPTSRASSIRPSAATASPLTPSPAHPHGQNTPH